MGSPAALLLLALFALVAISGAQVQGPVFLVEPPPRLVFSSSVGGRADCAVMGNPMPSVTWLVHESAVTTVPGLRIILENGSLVFPAFSTQEFRQSIHAAVYKCRASNVVGVVVSRDVHVNAVISGNYEPRIIGNHASIGIPVVLTCDKRDHINVMSWLRNDVILVPGQLESGSRYVATERGELLIRSVQQEDASATYSCLISNTLTGERKRSPSVMLTLSDAPSGMAPRFLAPISEVVVDNGRELHLLCSAAGNPTPVYSWFRESGGQLYPVVSTPRVLASHDVLYVRHVQPPDSGTWVCVARNQYGEQRQHTSISISEPLTVHIQPQLLVANTGTTATLNCTTGGSQSARVRWLHDGIDVSGSARVQAAGARGLSLVISRVSRSDRGMYQCLVDDGRMSAQASTELRLGDMAPELQYTFIEQALRGGPPVSLRCSAAGAPPPRFHWLLDGQSLNEIASSHRFTTGQYISKNSDVVAHLNISTVRTEDGGLYTCVASNSLGEASHTARLNIYGSPSIRSIGPIRVVAGSNTTLHCPYSGYPISSIRWLRRGQEVSNNMRLDIGSFGDLHVTRVDPISDAGGYTCIVTAPTGETVKKDLQVVVKNPPKLVPFSFPPDLEEGSSVQLLCGMTSGDRPVYFSWLKDGHPIPASLQIQEKTLVEFSFLIFSDVSSKHSGDYTCIASNIAAKVNYTAQLMVKVSPRWIHEPQDVSTLLGTPITIHCSARGFPEPRISWFKGHSSSILGQGSNPQDFRPLLDFDSRQMVMPNGSLMIPSASTYNEGQHLCKAENDIGPGLSKLIYVTVNEPAHFEVTSKNISARRNDPVTLICEVFGDNPIQVQWTHNMKKIDLNTYRLSMSEVRTESGLKSQLALTRAERRDSGAYRCQAENAYGRSEHIIYVAVQERPDAPVSLQVVEVGGRTVQLSWLRGFDGNSPLLGYLAQYQLLGSLNKDDWISAKVVNISLDSVKVSQNSEDVERHGGIAGLSEAVVCETTVSGLHPATAYTVRLAVYNVIDHSSYSEPVVVKTQEEAPMEAPSNVQVQVGGQGELQVTWKSPPHDTWNGELLGYLVTWSELNSNNPFPAFNVNSSKSVTVNGWSNSEITLTGLKKFTRYGVMVSAFNGVSAGPASLPISAITQEGVPEAPPNNILCEPLSSQSIKISWEPPPPSLHGGVLQGYKVIYKPLGSKELSGEIKRTSSAETFLHGLRKYTNYSVQVLAYTAAGDGRRSNPIYCLTEEDLPGSPSNIKASTSSDESVLVSWLPPTLKNGRILHYTVYWREAGRVGKQSTMTVTTDSAIVAAGYGGGDGPGGCLVTEVRGLIEHKLYEFWVSASTAPGEGEPTAIVAEATTSKVPARIASFGQVIQLPLRTATTLSCLAVGNPIPRTRWMHRGRAVTHSPHYQVTQKGHLEIHSMDSILSGNYTCIAKNQYSEDSITYAISALLAPSSPQIRLQHAASTSLKFHWSAPTDGGSPIQSYILHYAREGQPWQSVSISGELQSYTLDGLTCGSTYLIYMEAQNSVDKGPPSQRIRATTKGGVSKVPNEKDLISTNSTCLKLNLLTWDNGGCPIVEFIIEYRSLQESSWSVERTVLKTEGLVIENLKPSTWHYLRVTALNGAGSTTGKFYFSTLTPDGARIASPAVFPPHSDSEYPTFDVFGRLSTIFAGLAILALLALALLVFILFRNKRSSLLGCTFKGYSRGDISEDEKSVENQDNRRNCQQVYSSSPIKHSNGKNDTPAEMYEISPYATFSMNNGPSGGTGSGGRSVTASTLDYTVQFRTFGRSEGEALGPAPTRPNLHGHDRRSAKHRSFSSSDEYTLSKAMTMAAGGSNGHGANSRCRASRHGATSVPADSESDSSGSPCTECNSNPSYRVPINTPKDMFRPVVDSSAESQSEMSPGAIAVNASRRTPRRTAYHTGGRFRQEQERREFTIHV